MKAAAEEGQELHDLCETVVTTFPPEEWVDRALRQESEVGQMASEALAPVQARVVSEDLRLFRGQGVVPQGCYACEVQLESPLTGRQRLDFMARIDRHTAFIADYKSNRMDPDARLQMEAYALTLFQKYPDIRFVELMAPAPRVAGEDFHAHLERQTDEPRITAEIEGILAKYSDDFCPGRPSASCSVCSGNGRCPWQAASLSVIASDPSVAIVTKDQLLDPQTPEDRGRRKFLLQWLEKFCAACKEQDKEWLLRNPETELPGWSVTMVKGRESLDSRRRGEAVSLVEARLEICGEDLHDCVDLNLEALTEKLSERDGISKAEAKRQVKDALVEVMIRGQGYPRVTPAKKEVDYARLK